jgi:hypothetical protein
MTDMHESAFPRHEMPELCSDHAQTNRAQGMPGDDLTHGPPATKTQAAVTTGSAGSTDIPCAMVLTLLRALPGVHDLVVTVARGLVTRET